MTTVWQFQSSLLSFPHRKKIYSEIQEGKWCKQVVEGLKGCGGAVTALCHVFTDTRDGGERRWFLQQQTAAAAAQSDQSLLTTLSPYRDKCWTPSPRRAAEHWLFSGPVAVSAAHVQDLWWFRCGSLTSHWKELMWETMANINTTCVSSVSDVITVIRPIRFEVFWLDM